MKKREVQKMQQKQQAEEGVLKKKEDIQAYKFIGVFCDVYIKLCRKI